MMNPQAYSPSMAPAIIAFLAFVVLAVVFFFYKFRKGGFLNQKKELSIIERIAIDRKSGLLLVRAGAETHLVGFGPGGIQELSKIGNIEPNEPATPKHKVKIIAFPNLKILSRA